jgi:hypothetical protein
MTRRPAPTVRRAALVVVALALTAPPTHAAAQSAGTGNPARAADAATRASPQRTRPDPRPATSPADTFADATARALFDRARHARGVVDASISSYEAIVRQRAAFALRTPLRDRSLYREESATRVRWFRDGPDVVEVLAAREQHPGGVEVPSGFSDLMGDDLFDPNGDRLYLGMVANRDSSWMLHPLGRDAGLSYRFRSGDTITIAFPDGRRLRVVELQVLPRVRSARLVSGVLWIEPESGALVQAAYRLARDFDLIRDALSERESPGVDRIPGLFKPIEFRVDRIIVEYSLWNMRHWMPRTLRVDGLLRAGAVRTAFGMETAYDIHDIWTDGDSASARVAADSTLADWAAAGGEYREVSRLRGRARDYREVVRSDRDELLTHAELPPPIWRDAPEFSASADLRALERAIGRLPMPPRDAVPPDGGWSVGAISDMRYNRVEGLSVAATARLRAEPWSAGATLRLGTADRVPNAELSLGRETRSRALRFEAFHALRTVEEGDRALSFGPSVAALAFGRDDGDYFRATGAALTLRPAEFRRQSWRASVELARHRSVTRNTDWSLPSLWDEVRAFRETIDAEPGTAVTGTVVLAPWWGVVPDRPQAGAELLLQGAAGDFEFARARLTLRAATPLFAGLRLGAETAAGTSAGTPPIQRQWFLGGAGTLRGYPGAAAVGPEFARARVELGRATHGAGLAVFSDAGWAGRRADARLDDALLSAGVGFSVLDGLLRFDLARALRAPRGWRFEMYLDALL